MATGALGNSTDLGNPGAAVAQTAAAEAARQAGEEALREVGEEALREVAEAAAKEAAEVAAKRQAEEAARAAQADHSNFEAGSAAFGGYLAEVGGTGPAAERFAEDHAGALASLPPAHEDQVLDLVHGLCEKNSLGQSDIATDIANRNYRDIGKLLETGVLLAPDSTGKTVLANLSERLHQGLTPELAGRVDPKSLLSDLISTVTKPTNIFQGTGTNSCTGAVVQILMARSGPAEYVRFAAGLMFDGAGITPAGSRVPLDTSEFLDREVNKNTGRGPFNAIIQGSLVEYGRSLIPGQGEGVEGGRGRGTPGSYGGGRGNGVPGAPGKGTFGGGDEGLTAAQVGALVKGVFGVQATNVEINDTNRSMAEDLIMRGLDGYLANVEDAPASQRSVNASRALSRGVPVGIRTDEGRLHQVLVLSYEGNKVQYHDPGDGQTKEIDAKEFVASLASVMAPAGIPTKWARRMGVQEL